VDAFFVIAAFFAATSFNRMDTITLDRVRQYWAATARRVFPGMSVIVTATMMGAVFLLPSTMLFDAIGDATASFLFVQNWWLASNGIDYLMQDAPKSAFQQLWALSLQVQYYAILPLLFWFVAQVARRTAAPRILVWNVILGGLLVVSLAYSIIMTERIQPWAYFDSLARGWEYMVGALLAVNIARLPVFGHKAMKIAGYAALLILVSFAAIMPVSSLFPGYAALVPVLATAVIIWVSRSGNAIAPLRWKPLLALADISFAFYLWHWPLLVFYKAQATSEAVGLLPGCAIIVLAAGLAWATVHLVEAPFRGWPMLQRSPSLSMFASALLLVPAGSAVALAVEDHDAREATAAAKLAAFDPSAPSVPPGEVLPAPLIARNDLPVLYQSGCHRPGRETGIRVCEFGSPGASKTVVLVGGSHSTQWFPALDRLSREHGYRLITFLKSSCVYTTDTSNLDFPAPCHAFNETVEDKLLELKPDLVVTIATRGQGKEEEIPEGFKQRWRTLTEAGTSVLALRDNPWFPVDQVSCVDKYGADIQRCSVARDAAYNAVDPGRSLAMDNVRYVDTSPFFCGETLCAAVRGGVLLYRDRHHLNSTFVRTLADELSVILRQELGTG
jgi:peptidoglycan/LPS O-acetylase OafA/YrhL